MSSHPSSDIVVEACQLMEGCVRAHQERNQPHCRPWCAALVPQAARLCTRQTILAASFHPCCLPQLRSLRVSWWHSEMYVCGEYHACSIKCSCIVGAVVPCYQVMMEGGLEGVASTWRWTTHHKDWTPQLWLSQWINHEPWFGYILPKSYLKHSFWIQSSFLTTVSLENEM